eukprot:gnl/Chilomastix_cuspidata/1916.p1 GENE.gnl/Chilomastix_cuspidata/1916~~gnl/Chilomastix_cuspidata/1916.p1  ORF type:complete len:270 (+),score=69.35 gnl/Chilomastix_cuspidata/1916:31-810(+)
MEEGERPKGYIPPEGAVPIRRKTKKWRRWGQKSITLSLPMTLRCLSCNNFLYVNTKFNARKETVVGEDYLGIEIYRFYIKCTTCMAEITFRTNPKLHIYEVEHGAVQLVDHVQKHFDTVDEQLKERQEVDDLMEALEQRAQDSRAELKAIDVIQHLTERSQIAENLSKQNISRMIAREREKRRRVEREEFEKAALADIVEAPRDLQRKRVLTEKMLPSLERTALPEHAKPDQPPPSAPPPRKKTFGFAALVQKTSEGAK